ncbi:MAG: hypothetical protein ACIARR_04030, partial [Phycisphaerales bacterium JB059]
LALMWNDGDESTPVAGRYYELLRRVSTDGTLSHKMVAAGPTLAPPFERMERLTFRNEQRMDRAGLIGRAMSASYVPRSGPERDWLVEALGALHEENADAEGMVTFEYRVTLYLGERPTR